MCIKKFGLNRSIRFQDIEQKLNSDVNQGCNSVANLPKFELFQAFMHVLVTCKSEEDPINQSRTNGPINAHLTIDQVMPRYKYNNEKQEA